ncbi:MAG: HAD family hydrolase, partial [Anaerolineae bacterium]
MTLTLLLDLDDTLLDSHMEAFIPAYLQKLASFLSGHVAADRLLRQLMHGTRAMMANTDPACTLRETFDENFYPYLGVEREALLPTIERFYDEVFPTLRELTRPRPEAVDLVEWALAQGYRVAIATNPLFPRKAIEHRMRWAGLPPEKYPFHLVSSYETFHFTKPNPAYFLEVLGRLGWPDDPVIMVGDDPELDILPAQQAGLPTFWVTSNSRAAPASLRPLASGSLKEVRPWLEGVDPRRLEFSPGTPEALRAVLLSTPAALRGLLNNLPLQKWRHCPSPNEWCPLEIICHLRDVEREVNLPRLQRVLSEENPFIAGIDTDPWAKEREYLRQDGPAALQEFTTARRQTLSLLADLD